MIPMYRYLHDEPTVAAIVGTRIYRDWAGDSPTVPYVVWNAQAIVPANHMSDRPPADRYSVSVDCIATTEAQSDALMKACRYACETYGHVTSGPQSLGRDPGTGLWRWVFTVDIFINR